MRGLKKGRHIVVEKLKDEEGGWRDPHNVATVQFDEQAIEYLASQLTHLMSGSGEPTAQPECVQLWLGIDFPLEESIDFRIIGANQAGVWIDNGGGRVGVHAVLIPWTSIFAIHIHSEPAVKRGE